MSKRTNSITVAAAQLPARNMSDAAIALRDIEQAVSRAASVGADLLVLPECSYPCYWLGSAEAYFRAKADILPSSEAERVIAFLAGRFGLHIVAGLVHEAPEGLYNAAVLFSPQGKVVARAFKTFLWDGEQDWFRAGSRLVVAQTEIGRVGLIICAETRAPEIVAALSMQGAELLAMPTAWVNAATEPGRFYNPQPDFLIQARAKEFGLPFVCANKFGTENEFASFCGMSMIAGRNGEVLAKAPPAEPALLVARMEPAHPARRHLSDAAREVLDIARIVRPRADVPALRAAVITGQSLNHQRWEQENLAEWLRRMDVTLAIAFVGERGVEPLRRAADAVGLTLLAGPDDGPATVAGALIATMPAESLSSFAPARVAAMTGAHLICAFGDAPDLSILRARALENRIFLCVVGPSQFAVIGPSGQIVADYDGTLQQPAVVTLNLAEAADKAVADRTDIWQQLPFEACRRAFKASMSEP